jgi:hypothetical protein
MRNLSKEKDFYVRVMEKFYVDSAEVGADLKLRFIKPGLLQVISDAEYGSGKAHSLYTLRSGELVTLIVAKNGEVTDCHGDKNPRALKIWERSTGREFRGVSR